MKRPGRSLTAALGVALLLTACGSDSNSASESTSPASSSTSTVGSTATTPAAQNLRAKRYCEVLLVQVVDGQATADVYNSFPLNDCPDEQWTALDAGEIATAEGVTLAVLNGPRYWLMDRIEKQGGTDGLTKKDFGGIEMYRQASVDVGPIADAGQIYSPREVDRDTVFVFDAGREVHELTDPEGTTYVMQTWSQQQDATLGESDLAGLGDRLKLPTGWTFRSRTLDAPLSVVTTDSPARVLQDDLGNSYSQLTEE